MNRAVFALILAIAACAAPHDTATDREPVTYFVAPSGDDAATGLDAPGAFRTIGHAVSVLAPGDTLFILPGTYAEQIVLEGFGEPDAVTTIMGINGLPILDGSGALAPGIACWGCSNVEISCLDLRGFDGAGISISGSETVTLRDIVVSGVSGSAVEVRSSSDLVVEWFEMAGVGRSAILLSDVDGARIANNRVSDVGGEPYVLDGDDISAERNDVVGG